MEQIAAHYHRSPVWACFAGRLGVIVRSSSITSSSDRGAAASDLTLIVAAAAVVITLVGPGRGVVGGSLPVKLLFLSRMAALLLVATWLLYRKGRSWRDVGLRRPPLWRTIIVVPVALIFGAGLLAIAKTALTRAGYPGADYAIFRPIRGNLGEYLFWLLPVTVGSAALARR